MNRNEYGSSQHGEPSAGSENSIVSMQAETPIELSSEDEQRLARLAAIPDDTIDFTDIPRLTPEEYKATMSLIAKRKQILPKAS